MLPELYSGDLVRIIAKQIADYMHKIVTIRPVEYGPRKA